MKKFLCLFLVAFWGTGAIAAPDTVQNHGHKHYLKTSRSAQCGTPSGKASRECAQAQDTGRPQYTNIRRF